MKIGILGLPLVGKTTFFNLLTEMNAETRNFMGGDKKLNLGVARVPDKRINELSSIFTPEKTTYATIELKNITTEIMASDQVKITALMIVSGLNVDSNQYSNTIPIEFRVINSGGSWLITRMIE